MAKTAIEAAQRGTLFLLRPEEVVIATDPQSPFYCERSEKTVSEALITSIMRNGVIEPIVVAVRRLTDGTQQIFCQDGRQRLGAAIMANHRLRDQGLPEIRVPAIVRRDAENVIALVGLAANIHIESDVLERARAAQRLLDFGRTTAEVAEAMGVTEATIKVWLKRLEKGSSDEGARNRGGRPAGQVLHATKGMRRYLAEQAEHPVFTDRERALILWAADKIDSLELGQRFPEIRNILCKPEQQSIPE